MLDQKSLREIVDYDPGTGLFSWKQTQSRRKKPTDEVGYLHYRGYRLIWLKKRSYLAHRLAWLHVYGEWPSSMIDHINGDPSDNRIANLRLANSSLNAANARKPSNNTSGYKGVYKCRGRWKAQIAVGRISRFLGVFDTPETAHAAYVKASSELFGEFSRPD